MTGSTRLASTTAASVRAPYSAPQTTASSHLSPTTGSESSGPTRLPAPFVPREFRASVRSDVTVVPVLERLTAERTEATYAVAVDVPNDATPIAVLFNDDAAPTSDFAAFLESHDLDASDVPSTAELPWIEAFAADVPEPEDTWPLGEAGKRLDELTQSLSSLDASRERIQAERLNAQVNAPTSLPLAPEAAMPMWNEEEWIDIMPTAPSDALSPEDSQPSAPSAEVAPHDTSADQSIATALNAESAARALEGLAQRVRAGEVQVPVFQSELAQEAVLAGLLASMLGWRQ